MAISLSDIDFFLSGGSTNSNPNSSIGGMPSSFIIRGSMNNLFSDIASESAEIGRTDYRCFYIFNKSQVDFLYDAKVYFEQQGAAGASVTVGINKSTEVQKIIMNPMIFSGSLELRFGSNDILVNWGSSAGEFESNLQAELQTFVPGTTVSTEIQEESFANKIYNFTINFSGESDNKSYPILAVKNNQLLASGGYPSISISRISVGAPINSIASTIPTETTPPTGVIFYNSNKDSKLLIGTLGPGDGVPIWIKRITPSNTQYLEEDYFDFRISGRPF